MAGGGTAYLRKGVCYAVSSEWMSDPARKFYEYLRLRGRSPGTAYQNARYIHHFLTWLGKRPEEITREDIMNYVVYLRDNLGYSEGTIKNRCHAISSFLKFIGRDDLAKWVPIPSPKGREIEWLPEDLILRVVDGDPYLRTAYELALRVSELLMLRRNEYDPKSGEIVVYREKHKGKPNRYVLKLPDEVREILNKHIMETVCPDGRIFCISRKAIQVRFKRALRRAGLDPSKYTFHVLRHSKCTNIVIKYLKEGKPVDIVTLAKFMGHLDPRTTMTYVHLASRVLGIETPITL
jgi:integrase